MKQTRMLTWEWKSWAWFYLLGYTGIMVVMELFYHSAGLSIASGFGVVFLSKTWMRHLEEKRRKVLLAQFRDFLAQAAGSFATGRHLLYALMEAQEALGMIYHKRSPMMEEIQRMITGLSESRESEEMVLREFSHRNQVQDIRHFVDVYLTCRMAGGDLGFVISESSRMLLDKMSMEREIQVLTVQKQLEGRIISVIPLAILFLLQVTSPDYLEPLYTTLSGRILMTLSLLAMVFSFIMTRKITRIEV